MAPPISFLEPPPPYTAQPVAAVPRHDRQLELPPPYSVDERDTAGLLVNESPDGHCPPQHGAGRMSRSTSPCPSSPSAPNFGLMPVSPNHPRVDRVQHVNGGVNGSSNTANITDTSCESRKEPDDIESAREAVDLSHETAPLGGMPGVECPPQITVTTHTPSGNLFRLTGMSPVQAL